MFFSPFSIYLSISFVCYSQYYYPLLSLEQIKEQKYLFHQVFFFNFVIGIHTRTKLRDIIKINMEFVTYANGFILLLFVQILGNMIDLVKIPMTYATVIANGYQ
jgi:hypothetical protein